MQYFLSPGLKSDILGGNYLSHRQQPPASTHILRTLRGYAEASACAVTQVLLYINKHALSSVFPHIFRIFSIFLRQKLFCTPNRVFQSFSEPLIRVFSENLIPYFTLFLCVFQYTVPGVLKFCGFSSDFRSRFCRKSFGRIFQQQKPPYIGWQEPERRQYGRNDGQAVRGFNKLDYRNRKNERKRRRSNRENQGSRKKRIKKITCAHKA